MKALLLLDPERRAEQRAALADRARVLVATGDRLWVEIDPGQVDRLAALGIAVQPQEGLDQIALPALLFDPAQGEPAVPPALASTTTPYHVVQFIVPPEPAWLQDVADLGGLHLDDVPAHAALYRLTDAQATAARALPEVSWVGRYQPAYAVSHTVAGADEPFTAATLASARPDRERLGSPPDGALRVAFFADVDLDAAADAVAAAGCPVVDRNGQALVVNCPPENFNALLQVPGVQVVEPQLVPDTFNQRAGIILGANQVRHVGSIDFLVNLDGRGEIVGVFDSGLDNGAVPTNHIDFNDPATGTSRVISIDNLNTIPGTTPPVTATALDVIGHGTHVAGSIVGNGATAAALPAPAPGAPPPSVPRGIAPAARLLLTSANRFVMPPPPSLPINFNRHLTAFQNHWVAGARVISNSWGSVFQNHYTNDSAALDRFAWLHPDTVVLFSAGNGEADFNNNGRLDQNSMGPSATAKNMLVIGATENVTSVDGDGRNYLSILRPCHRFGTLGASPVRQAATAATPFSFSDSAQDMALFSNRGRARNPVRPNKRRVRPDLVAPGTNLLSTRSGAMALAPTVQQVCPPPVQLVPNARIAQTAPAASYTVNSGTSMATPLAAGACLLVRQFYRERYGQLRRPNLVAALPSLVDRPVAVGRGDRRLLVWVQHDATANRNDLAAALYDQASAPDGTVVVLASGVGDTPAPAVALHDSTALLLWRDAAGALKLAAFDTALQPLPGFGTAGVATLATGVHLDDEHRPGLAVHGDEVAVAWFAAGGSDLLWRRFASATGAPLEPAPRTLGPGSATSNHPYIVHNGGRWAVVWTAAGITSSALQLRFIANDGQPEGTLPRTLAAQLAGYGAPHLAWDARQGRFLVAAMSELPAGRGIQVLRLDADGAPMTAPLTAVPLPATAHGRRPRLDTHPDGGFVLLWEDDTAGSFDLWLAFLDATGAPGMLPRLQISDTPEPIAGFSAVVDGNGVVPVWLSRDEANADVEGLFLLGIGKNGVFAAQQDPATPLLEQQFYVRQTLLSQPFTDRPATALAWAGGDFYALRLSGDALTPDLALVHTSADGLPDAGFGPGGARRIARLFAYSTVSLAWTGSLLAVGVSFGPQNQVMLLQPDGTPVASFGTLGVVDLGESAAEPVHLQLASQGTGDRPRLFVAYGRWSADGLHTLRLSRRDARGTALAPARTLAQASGTAQHGWFHRLATESMLAACWHAPDGARTRAFVQRYSLEGAPQAGHASPIALTADAGESLAPVIAPRPVRPAPSFPPTAGDSALAPQREFGAAWQHRATVGTGNWQIWFSRLGRNGVPVATAGQFDVAVVASATDHATEPQLVWHGDGYGLAWLQQPAAGGNHQLMFTVLDGNGVRPDLAASGPTLPASDFAVTAAGVDVQRYQLVWAGASFRIGWTEIDGANQLHRQRNIALPRPASGARYDAPFQQPSAALVKATLINGATNLRNTALPNAGNDVNDGYGWGRINLRQALAPAQPVSFHVRDDACVGPGRSVRYAMRVRRGTRLLRITLAWTDLPGADLVNRLHLRVTTPAFNPGGVQVLHGNQWRTAVGQTHLSDPVGATPPPFEDIHPVQQVVLAAPPDLPEGDYTVEVICAVLGGGPLQPFPGQPFALVVVGSGAELRTAANPPAAPTAVY